MTSRRGSIEAPARISHVREGVVFAPWHYGSSPGTAANELTLVASPVTTASAPAGGVPSAHRSGR